jgi:hypothetical protein
MAVNEDKRREACDGRPASYDIPPEQYGDTKKLRLKGQKPEKTLERTGSQF